MNKRAMISQPMAGKTDEEIAEARDKAHAKLREMGYEFVNTLFTDEWYSDEAMEERGVVQVPLCYLAKSLENMSLCHAAYFGLRRLIRFCRGGRALGGMRMAYRTPAGDGPKGPSTKSAHPLRDEWALRKGRSSYVLWTDEMIRRMQAHPERTAAEIAAELRVTPSAVRHARQRYGRFSTGTDGLCIVCDARPVFDTSAQAKKWRLCKGCYLAERKRRLEEEAESNRIRQAAHRRQKLDGDA